MTVLCPWSRTGKKKLKFTSHFKKHGVHFKHAYCMFQIYRKQADCRAGVGGAEPGFFKIQCIVTLSFSRGQSEKVGRRFALFLSCHIASSYRAFYFVHFPLKACLISASQWSFLFQRCILCFNNIFENDAIDLQAVQNAF